MLATNILLLLLLFTRLAYSSLECSSHNFEFTAPKGYSYSTVSSKNEYIVKFRNFDTKTNRRRFLNEFFQSINISCYEIVEKKPIFDTYPSDFDVVRIEEATFKLKSDLVVNASQYIRGIYEQRKVIRKLISSPHNNDNDDDDQYLDESEYEAERRAAKKQQGKKKKEGGGERKKRYKKRQMNRAIPKDLIDILRVREVWSRGHVTGRGVNVAVFDTGLEENHPHFKYVRERIDWTDEHDPIDRVGHGTFVCGLIASRSRECLGLAPDVNLFVFKIFTKNQISYTSWFLDAFNYALLKNIDVLNLSIGGPDFMDMPFVNKVWEITSKGIIMVSGIGNDGPLYGTLNNPADQLDIIGVGGINSDDQIAKFSSRGMTTWELPSGYGRVKPDILTYSAHVRGSKRRSGCRTLSGTSVASPIMAGAIALLVSLKRADPERYADRINPGSVKQVLLASADRIEDANVFEQGAGKLNLIRAFTMMREYTPQASLFPSYLDLTECPYFWPYCTQPLYYTGMPVIFNVTILNGIHSSGTISKKPIWRPSESANGHYLKMSISYSSQIWPWSGYLAIKMVVSEEAAEFDGVVEGEISLEVESLVSEPGSKMMHSIRSPLKLFVRARIITTPPRQQRLLWDQFHNLRYPSGYFPRDDLKMKKDLLDWNADHLHTNFKDLYQYLRSSGYFLEVLGENINCFDASNYGALLIIDPEEEFHPSEVNKLYEDVSSKGLSLIVFAEWYNASVIKEAKFYDENSRKWWTPVTGGANIPALNNLLDPFGIGLSDRVYEGEYRVSQHSAGFVSGTSIVKFPQSKSNYVLLRDMKDQGEEFLADVMNKTLEKGARVEKVAILGLAQTGSNPQDSGRVVVYGDSNCIDSSHIKNDCFWLLSVVIEYACHNLLFSGLKETNSLDFVSQDESSIVRSDDISRHNLKNYSKVLGRETLTCLELDFFLPTNTSISTIPSDDRPSKKNFYRFLRFDSSNIDFDELPSNGLPERGIYDLFDDNDKKTSNDNDLIGDDNDLLTNFPFLALFAVVLVFFYFFYKFVLRKKQRLLFKRHNSNQNLRRFPDKGKFNH